MSETECCGNCKYFKDEDAVGWGRCVGHMKEFGVHCSHTGCLVHKFAKNAINGWTEITPDNIDKIRKSKKKIVIMNPREWDVPEMLYSIKADSLVLYSEWGGYYYYVLPELKIE